MVPFSREIEGISGFFWAFRDHASLWSERMELGLSGRGMGSDPLWRIIFSSVSETERNNH